MVFCRYRSSLSASHSIRIYIPFMGNTSFTNIFRGSTYKTALNDWCAGVTFERFLEATNNHKRVNILYDPSHFVLQQLDYIEYIDHYHEFIKSFHVKDSEFKPNGKKGAFGGYGDWIDRAGRYRSPGDGQIDFKTIFTKLTEYGCDVWAVMEWECCIKSPEQGAREGAPFIKNHIIEATQKTFDDFAGGEIDKQFLKNILNL